MAGRKMAKTPAGPQSPRPRTEAEPHGDASREAVLIPMGRLGAAHGLSGWLRVVSYADPPERIRNYRNWTLLVNGVRKQANLRSLRLVGGGLACLLDDVNTRETAEALGGAEIHIDRGALPPTREDEWYWTDLKGLEVRNLEGERLGDVADLMATGANDVLVVQGERRRLIPFLPGSRVREVDLDAGRLIVDWDASY